MKKVLEKRPTRAITVFVDMKDVDKAAKKVCSLWLPNCRHLLPTIYRKVYLETRRTTVATKDNLM